MPGFFRAENVVHVENVVAVLVVETVVFETLARLREHSPWVARRLVFEMGVADAVGRRQVDSESLQGLDVTQLLATEGKAQTCRVELTLINPPSGFARRNGGWVLTMGRSSLTPRSFLNSGTGPSTGLPPELLLPPLLLASVMAGSCGRLGDL